MEEMPLDVLACRGRAFQPLAARAWAGAVQPTSVSLRLRSMLYVM
jgi:hypothetical protein